MKGSRGNTLMLPAIHRMVVAVPVVIVMTTVDSRARKIVAAIVNSGHDRETIARRFPTANEYTSWSFTPLDKMLGNLTASGLHFERHHGGIPTIDPAKHTLLVHGMVDAPKTFTIADLKRFPFVTRKHFIECSGNGLTEWNKPTMKTVQGTHGLLSTSEWTGVQFATIAREIGLKDGSTWVLAEGSDAAVMTRSIPMEKMLKDALLVYGQNGEALRPEQGYPLRLLLPGYEGNTHIKWLRRLQVSDKPFMTREETSKYTDLLADGKARQFSMDMEAKSVITFPSGEMKLPGPGYYNVTGWPGAAAGACSRSMCPSTAARPGIRRSSTSRRIRSARSASAIRGCGTASRRSCKAAAPMRRATSSRR